MSVYEQIVHTAAEHHKMLAVLIDPEKCNAQHLANLVDALNRSTADFVFVGGSQLQCTTKNVVEQLKKRCHIPVVIFPGNAFQLCNNADALLLPALISGRNAEWLIGQHVAAARAIQQSRIETIPVGYILVDGNKTTAVECVSHTLPLPIDNVEQIVATALAGEQIGKKLIYLEAGSGANRPVPTNIIKVVKRELNIPLIVGGGIVNTNMLENAYNAGADLVVVGNHFENNVADIINFSAVKSRY